MANSSIYAAFERMWQHIVALVGTRAESNHKHDDMYYTEAEVDAKLDQIGSDYEAADATLSTTLTNSIDEVQGNLISHTENKLNPHDVTKAQVGLSDVDNTSDANKPVSSAQATAIADAKKAGTIAQTMVEEHYLDNLNPHHVTKGQVGLGNVENKSSETIRSELTSENVVDALGYTPPQQDTVYTHPSYTAKASGLYKVTVDATGHISAASAATKDDLVALGLPAQDTTYTLSSFGITASATELNYVDGVTSNVQIQLNDKAPTSYVDDAITTKIAECLSKTY